MYPLAAHTDQDIDETFAAVDAGREKLEENFAEEDAVCGYDLISR